MGSSLRIAIVGLGLLSPLSALEYTDIHWGGVAINIPIPKGYERIDGINGQFDELYEGFLPETNELLILFAPASATQLLKTGRFPEFERSFNAQGLKKLKDANVSQKDFLELCKEVKKTYANPNFNMDSQLSDLGESGSASLSDMLGEETSVGFQGLRYLGTFNETDHSLCFAMSFNVKTEALGVSESEPAVSVGAIVRLHGKVIFLYCDAGGTVNDLNFAKRAMTSWIEKTLKANEGLATVMASKPETNIGVAPGLDGFLLNGGIGLGLGVLGVLFLLFRKLAS
ncbi:MAG: hypothetical protein AAGJ79_09115 [Verrucomicrobiota bacterium]